MYPKRSNGALQCWMQSLLLCGMAFWVIYRFAEGTTLLRPDEYCWDSALFQVIGKLWADGLCPYVDIFDHKGPLLFLIQKIAYHFSQPRTALYVLESLFVYASLLLCQQTLRLKMPSWQAFAGSVLMLVFWLPLMEYGNLSETYSMPFVLLAMWLQMRYLTSGAEEHPAGWAFVYGLCFGANMMIRPNNGLVIAVITLMITIRLAARGMWRSITFNAVALITGVLTAVVPFVSYFAVRGALNEFVYATWTFNLIYANHLRLSLDWGSLRNVLFFITPALLSGAMGVICWLRKQTILGWINVACAVVVLASTLSGVGYAHYFMLHVPLIPLALYTAACLRGRHSKGWNGVLAAVCIGFTLLTVRTTLSVAPNQYLLAPSDAEIRQEQVYNQMVAEIENQIPPEERSAVALCGLPVNDVEIILNSDIRPLGRYCFLMEWHAQADEEILWQYIRFIESKEAKWLLMRDNGISSPHLLSAVEDGYELHMSYALEDVHYLLYRCKTSE